MGKPVFTRGRGALKQGEARESFVARTYLAHLRERKDSHEINFSESLPVEEGVWDQIM